MVYILFGLGLGCEGGKEGERGKRQFVICDVPSFSPFAFSSSYAFSGCRLREGGREGRMAVSMCEMIEAESSRRRRAKT